MVAEMWPHVGGLGAKGIAVCAPRRVDSVARCAGEAPNSTADIHDAIAGVEVDNAVACVVTLFQVDQTVPSPTTEAIPSEVAEILDQFKVVFSEPKQLPENK